jgi:hypothetical protein
VGIDTVEYLVFGQFLLAVIDEIEHIKSVIVRGIADIFGASQPPVEQNITVKTTIGYCQLLELFERFICLFCTFGFVIEYLFFIKA